MEKFNRGIRRHHAKRLKQKRKNYYGYYSFNTGTIGDFRYVPNARHIGMLVHTARLCSCGLCSYHDVHPVDSSMKDLIRKGFYE